MYEYIGSIDHLDFDSDVYPWNLCCQGTCSRSKLEFPMLNLTKKYIYMDIFINDSNQACTKNDYRITVIKMLRSETKRKYKGGRQQKGFRRHRFI